MKILIADDDRVTRALVKRVVGRGGTAVFEAENGLDALSLVEREDPDILITDLRMPVLDGFELITAVRASPKHRLLPVICLSSVSERQDITRLATMGITDYVLKPPQAVELLARLEKVVRKHSHWKTHRATSDDPGAQAPGLLLIDSNAEARAAARGQLEPAYFVIEAPSGADGLRELRSLANPPIVVIVAEGLQLLASESIPALVRRLMAESDATPPTILLLTASEPSAEVAAHFDGVIRRTRGAEGLLELVNRARNSPALATAGPVSEGAGFAPPPQPEDSTS